MTSIARVIHNYDKGSSDQVLITFEGEVIWRGKSFPDSPTSFLSAVKHMNGVDYIEESSLDDDQIEGWYND